MRLHDDQFIGGHFCWFTGIVEDIQDLEGLDRVRVRAIGYHSDDKGEVPTASLPLATVMGSTLNAGHKGVGSNHQLVIGSWVIGFFRDGASAQDPVIIGTIASSQPDGTLDMPQEAQADPNNNKVYRSEGGHVVEFDNTLNASRIKVTHNKGTSILIDKDGNVLIGTTDTNLMTTSGDGDKGMVISKASGFQVKRLTITPQNLIEQGHKAVLFYSFMTEQRSEILL